MCRTPAPPSTALVASSIWSGVGEVKTSPGHAASSIPGPTKPPCIGSWTGPPPGGDRAPPVPRLVPPPASGDDRDLATHRRVDADHDVRLVHHPDSAPVGGLHTLQGLADHSLGIVDELL